MSHGPAARDHHPRSRAAYVLPDDVRSSASRRRGSPRSSAAARASQWNQFRLHPRNKRSSPHRWSEQCSAHPASPARVRQDPTGGPAARSGRWNNCSRRCRRSKGLEVPPLRRQLRVALPGRMATLGSDRAPWTTSPTCGCCARRRHGVGSPRPTPPPGEARPLVYVTMGTVQNQRLGRSDPSWQPRSPPSRVQVLVAVGPGRRSGWTWEPARRTSGSSAGWTSRRCSDGAPSSSRTAGRGRSSARLAQGLPQLCLPAGRRPVPERRGRDPGRSGAGADARRGLAVDGGCGRGPAAHRPGTPGRGRSCGSRDRSDAVA